MSSTVTGTLHGVWFFSMDFSLLTKVYLTFNKNSSVWVGQTHLARQKRWPAAAPRHHLPLPAYRPQAAPARQAPAASAIDIPRQSLDQGFRSSAAASAASVGLRAAIKRLAHALHLFRHAGRRRPFRANYGPCPGKTGRKWPDRGPAGSASSAKRSSTTARCRTSRSKRPLTCRRPPYSR